MAVSAARMDLAVGTVGLVAAGEIMASPVRSERLYSQEKRGAQSFGGDPVAVSFRDALDEPVKAQAPQVIRDPSRAELARLLSEQ